MKILDRYLFITFLKNYLISFLVLVGLYITLDMVFNFDDLVEAPKSAVTLHLTALQIIIDIVAYYAFQTPLIFVYLSGMIAVVGAAFTLMRLARFNELTAILAAGISLRRVALPIIVTGMLLNGLLVADQEMLIPLIIPQLIRSHEEMHTPTPKSYGVQFMLDDQNGLFSAARYTPPAKGILPTIEYLDVVERDANLLPSGHLYADSAQWDDARRLWTLTNGRHVKIIGPDDDRPESPTTATAYKSDITPDEIALWRGGQYVALLPTRRINELLQRPKSYGVNELLRTKNLRFSQPVVNIILLLIACPCVLTREPGQMKSAAMKCLFLCGLCMGTVFITYQLAAHPPPVDWARHWPALMAWMPIFLFAPVSVWLLDRIRT